MQQPFHNSLIMSPALKPTSYPGLRPWKVVSLNPGRSSGRIFFFRVNFVCWLFIRCPFRPRFTAVARKRPWSFCQKCRWQVTPEHTCTFDPTKLEWVDYATVQAWCGNLPGNELTCTLSGNTWTSWFQLAEPLWTDPGLKSGISVHELISTSKKKKKKKKHRRGTNCWTFSQNPHTWGKRERERENHANDGISMWSNVYTHSPPTCHYNGQSDADVRNLTQPQTIWTTRRPTPTVCCYSPALVTAETV